MLAKGARRRTPSGKLQTAARRARSTARRASGGTHSKERCETERAAGAGERRPSREGCGGDGGARSGSDWPGDGGDGARSGDGARAPRVGDAARADATPNGCTCARARARLQRRRARLQHRRSRRWGSRGC